MALTGHSGAVSSGRGAGAGGGGSGHRQGNQSKVRNNDKLEEDVVKELLQPAGNEEESDEMDDHREDNMDNNEDEDRFDEDGDDEEPLVWSGMESAGMLEAKCSLLVPVDSMYEAKLKSLPPGRHVLTQDKAAPTDGQILEVDFAGCTILQLEPTVVLHHSKTNGTITSATPMEVMPVTLTVAGRCTFTQDNWRDFSIMMRTPTQSEEMKLPPNGHFEWPDVTAMLLCPLCGTIQPHQHAHQEYWMVFYPLLQITVLKGSKMTMGFRTICRLACLDCMEDLLQGMSVKVPTSAKPASTASEEEEDSHDDDDGGADDDDDENVIHNISSGSSNNISFELSAMTILEEAGSASFLQDHPPRPAEFPHVDDPLDAWTLYNLWEQTGSWEALQTDYRRVLSRSMHATAAAAAKKNQQQREQQQLQARRKQMQSSSSQGLSSSSSPPPSSMRKPRQTIATQPKQRYSGQPCGNENCDKVHGQKKSADPEDGRSGIVRLSVSCNHCSDAVYCSKACRREAADQHRKVCPGVNQKSNGILTNTSSKFKSSSTGAQMKKQVQCWKCKTVKPYTEMKKCSCCRTATYCGGECQREDWARHKDECPHLKEEKERMKKLRQQNEAGVIVS